MLSTSWTRKVGLPKYKNEKAFKLKKTAVASTLIQRPEMHFDKKAGRVPNFCSSLAKTGLETNRMEKPEKVVTSNRLFCATSFEADELRCSLNRLGECEQTVDTGNTDPLREEKIANILAESEAATQFQRKACKTKMVRRLHGHSRQRTSARMCSVAFKLFQKKQRVVLSVVRL